jgi:16S rRNA (guanine966-N2)-methyltransferase
LSPSRTLPKRPSNQIRIISGRWRGKRVHFDDAPGLRPTPDRIRETLFNWLQTHICHRTCLDLFAGSGILGFEALSRGAAHAVLIEANPLCYRTLCSTRHALNEPSCDIIQADALEWIQHQSHWPYNVIFIDPPYQSNLLEPTLNAVCQRSQPDTLIYWEHPETLLPNLPPPLSPLEQGKAGKVCYYLGKIVDESGNANH